MTERERLLIERRQELLTVKEFAALTRQHPESVRRRVREGRQVGAMRVGGQWMIDFRRCCELSSVQPVV